jgi:hypothetical protein
MPAREPSVCTCSATFNRNHSRVWVEMSSSLNGEHQKKYYSSFGLVVNPPGP